VVKVPGHKTAVTRPAAAVKPPPAPRPTKPAERIRPTNVIPPTRPWNDPF
jgi:hypothetical protein